MADSGCVLSLSCTYAGVLLGAFLFVFLLCLGVFYYERMKLAKLKREQNNSREIEEGEKVLFDNDKDAIVSDEKPDPERGSNASKEPDTSAPTKPLQEIFDYSREPNDYGGYDYMTRPSMERPSTHNKDDYADSARGGDSVSWIDYSSRRTGQTMPSTAPRGAKPRNSPRPILRDMDNSRGGTPVPPYGGYGDSSRRHTADDMTLSAGMEVLVVALSSSEGGSWCGQWEGRRGMFGSTKALDSQLEVAAGDLLLVVGTEAQGWVGRCRGTTGLFPWPLPLHKPSTSPRPPLHP